jgi:hypothetical protein
MRSAYRRWLASGSEISSTSASKLSRMPKTASSEPENGPKTQMAPRENVLDAEVLRRSKTPARASNHETRRGAG